MNMDLGFWKLAAEDRDHIAIIDHEGNELTAGALLDRANQLAHGLRGLGVGHGDVVAGVLRSEPDSLALFMAVAQIGVYLVPVNWHLTAPEIAYILENSGAKAVVCSPLDAAATLAAADEAGVMPRYCTAQADGFQLLDALAEGQPTTLPDARVAGAVMTYTSGTTGRPKGVKRPLPPVAPELIGSSYAMFLCLFGIQPKGDGVHLVVSPLYHTAVLNFATSAMHLGHTVVLMDRWTPQGCLDVIGRHRVTHSHMVPTQFVRMLGLPDDVRAAADVSSLRHIVHSAAPCPVDIKRAMIDWWGPVIYEYYAATEGGGTLVGPEEWLTKPGTVGRAWPQAEIEVRDDDGARLPAGEVGTVWICMGTHKFEYHKDDQKTGEAWRDRFFTVGDAGYLDEDGYLFLRDRKADMIISGGVNIYPAEIEAVLIGHEWVDDVAVFGIPDPDWGEQVKAVVQARPGTSVGPDAAASLLAWAGERLARYKCPRSVDFVDQLPRDPNGKLYKRKLRDPYWAQAGRSI